MTRDRWEELYGLTYDVDNAICEIKESDTIEDINNVIRDNSQMYLIANWTPQEEIKFNEGEEITEEIIEDEKKRIINDLYDLQAWLSDVLNL